MWGMINARGGLLVVGAAAAVLGLGACGGSSKPAQQASTSKTTTPTSTTTPAGTKPSTGGASSTTTRTAAEPKQGSKAAEAQQGSPRFHAAQVRAIRYWVQCLHRHGVKTPPPNTSGHGPILKESEVDTSSPQFKRYNRPCLDRAEVIFHEGLK